VTGEAYNSPQETLRKGLSLSPPGLGRGNAFADLLRNRSKLLERSQVRVDQCSVLGARSLRFDSAVIISIN
jgi:hypothetical protein